MKQLATSLRVVTASPVVRVGFGVLASSLALLLALHDVSSREVWAILSQAQPGFVGLALLSVAVNTVSKAIRWRVFMGDTGRKRRFSSVLIALLVGQMLNNLLPVRLGELGRVYALGKVEAGGAFVVGTIVIEKLFDILAYAALFLLLLLLIPLPAWVDQSVVTLIVLALLIVLVTAILIRYRLWLVRMLERSIGWLPLHIRAQAVRHFHTGLTSLEVLQHRRDLVALVLWTGIIWLTALLNNYLVLLALQLVVPPVASLLILIVLQAGISLPSIPGNIGIFEYGCVLALGVFGVGQTIALSYGILLHAIVLLPPTLLGLVFFWMLGLSFNLPSPARQRDTPSPLEHTDEPITGSRVPPSEYGDTQGQ